MTCFQEPLALGEDVLCTFLSSLDHHLRLEPRLFWSLLPENIATYEFLLSDFFTAAIPIKAALLPERNTEPLPVVNLLRSIYEDIFRLFIRLSNGLTDQMGASSVSTPPPTSRAFQTSSTAGISLRDEEEFLFLKPSVASSSTKPVVSSLFPAPLTLTSMSDSSSGKHVFSFENFIDFIYLYVDDAKKMPLIRLCTTNLLSSFKSEYQAKFFSLLDMATTDSLNEYLEHVVTSISQLSHSFVFKSSYFSKETGKLDAMIEADNLSLVNRVVLNAALSNHKKLSASMLDVFYMRSFLKESTAPGLNSWDKDLLATKCLECVGSMLDVGFLSLETLDFKGILQLLQDYPNLSDSDRDILQAYWSTFKHEPVEEPSKASGSQCKTKVSVSMQRNPLLASRKQDVAKEQRFSLDQAMMTQDRDLLKQRIMRSVVSTGSKETLDEASNSEDDSVDEIPVNVNRRPLEELLEEIDIEEEDVSASERDQSSRTFGQAGHGRGRGRGGFNKHRDNHSRKEKSFRKARF